MAKNWIETVTGSFDDKRRWKAYKTRTRQLPDAHKDGLGAVERYLMATGDIPADGQAMLAMFENLVELFEQAAADGTPIRDVVGTDPAEFAQEFARTFSNGGWIAREREKLARRIDRASDEEPER